MICGIENGEGFYNIRLVPSIVRTSTIASNQAGSNVHMRHGGQRVAVECHDAGQSIALGEILGQGIMSESRLYTLGT
jgi:hypothetical protein